MHMPSGLLTFSSVVFNLLSIHSNEFFHFIFFSILGFAFVSLLKISIHASISHNFIQYIKTCPIDL